MHVKFLQNDFTVDLRSGQLALPTFVRTSGEMYGTGCVICTQLFLSTRPGLSSLGVPGVPWHPQIVADQLTLSQPRGQIMPTKLLLASPGFSDLPMALHYIHNSRVSVDLQIWRDSRPL